MTSQQILQADLIDILFEHRNKQYGAYQLRKTYPHRLLKALSLGVGAALLLLFLFRPSFSKGFAVAANGEVIVHDFILPEQKKPAPPKAPEVPKNQVRQQNFTDRIQMKKMVANPLPPVDAMKNVAISDVTTDGLAAPVVQAPQGPENKGTEATGNAAKPEPEKEIVPDRQPQFPGGIQAWRDFLSRNLHAPEDLENGEKRTVVIRFHVAEDGSVANFKVEQSAGSAFDEEVIRVLKKMPKWTPAMQGGRPVSVSFTQPVTFVGVEQ